MQGKIKKITHKW